jgi:hypothetical protein
MAKKEKTKIGKQVTYVPNGVDFSIRPKNTEAAAIITNKYEQAVKKDGKDETRLVTNLVVFHDGDVPVVAKKRVPHKDDALDGESYYE